MNVFKRTNVFKIGMILMSFMAFTSCSSDDDMGEPDVIDIEKEPIVLDCYYFNEDRVLVNDPERPVDYVISCMMKIKGTKIEIEPGTVIEFKEKGGIRVEGNNAEGFIKAIGTSSEPIIFRGTKNEKGHWHGIDVRNNNSNNELQYVKILDAGRGNSPALRAGLNAALIIENSEIYNNEYTGLSIYTATPFGGVDDGTYKVVIENNKVYDNKWPIAAHIQDVGSISSTNDFSGNEIDEIYVGNGNSSGYNITQDVTWQGHELPYIIDGGDVDLYAKLTIEPGATLKFDVNRGLLLHKPSWGRGSGRIYAVGTAEKPITFTSIEDMPKYWRGIFMSSRNVTLGNEIGYAIIENTGHQGTSGGTEASKGNVVLVGDNSQLDIHDVTFRNINPIFCAVRGRATVSNITVIGHEEGEYCIHNPDHRSGNNLPDM